MLSRVADCLYWMSRYVERAENIARIVDVNTQLMLDVPLHQSQQLRKNWFAVVACLGEEEGYKERHKEVDSATVSEFLIFDRDNANSIVSCLCAARENGRTVREQISTEMWEELNRAYLWVVSKPARQAYERNQHEFAQRIKQVSHLFQGITDTTMVHGEGWTFIQLGKYLERADKTSRVLDDEFHLLEKSDSIRGRELLQWVAVLRSCSARQIYQKVYVSHVTPIKVAELLLLNEHFPRSVRFCLQHFDHCLRTLSGVAAGHFSNLPEKLTGRMLADLSFSVIEDIYAPGLHQAMDELQIKLNRVGGSLLQTYIHPALPPEPAGPMQLVEQ